jgi:mono/diheme cytochrome c family protein
MRTLTIMFFSCLLGIGCTMRTPKSSSDGEDLLPSSFYRIDPTLDTTITTAQGARLTIPAGAFGDPAGDASGGGAGSKAGADPGADGRIRLEIKEAYTIADIIKGRLITTTHGMPLSSGGMIYINIAGGGMMKLRKPIKVAIPTKGLQEGMQLYKGVKDPTGKLDWVDAKPLLKTRADSELAVGKALFVTNCATCHGLGKIVTGPPLAWITEREHDRHWLHDFICNNTKVLGRNDPYACYLFNLYNKTPMNIFPHLTDVDIDRILRYISNASQTIDSTTVLNYRMGFDSCMRYTRLRASLLEKRYDLVQRREGLVADNGPEVVDGRYTPLAKVAAPPPPPASPSVFVFREHVSEYYQFEIDATGWYNCDRLLGGMDGVAESTLRVRVLGAHRKEADVFLVVPSVKVMMVGLELSDTPDVYVFHTADGKMLLPQGVPAFILSMGEDKGQPVYGKVKWTTSLTQELTLEPVTMSKEAINTAIAQLGIADLQVTARDSKHAAEIRSIDTAKRATDSLLKLVEGLKPQFCDCDCHIGVAEGRDSAETDTAVVTLLPPVKAK